MAALWPAATGDLGNRLAVAITALRRGVDPDRQHPTDWVVVSRSGMVSLDLSHVEVDVVEFTATAQCGLRLAAAGRTATARSVMEAAVRAHHGQFLPEETYEDWSIPAREQDQELLARSLCSLGDLAAADGAADLAYDYAHRALAERPSHPQALALLDRLG